MKIIMYVSILMLSQSLFAQLGLSIEHGKNNNHLGTGGYIRVGAQAGSILSIDDKGLQVHQGVSGVGTLHLNDFGGDIYMARNTQSQIGIGTIPSNDSKVSIYQVSSNSYPALQIIEGTVNNHSLIHFRNGVQDNYWEIKANAHSSKDMLFGLYDEQFNTVINFLEFDGLVREIRSNFDIVPIPGRLPDLGNYSSTQHWDQVIADTYVNYSDARLKKEVQSVGNVLDKVMKLNPVSYKYKDTFSKDDRLRMGLLAQEVLQLFPDCVITEDVDIDPNGKMVRNQNEFLGISYMELIPILIKGLQELTDRVVALESEIENTK